MSVLDAAARAVWAVTYPDALDTYDDPELRPERDLARAQARAALAVAPAPSDDDREALNRAWNEGWEASEGEHLRGSLTVEQRGNPYARRSPVSPSETDDQIRDRGFRDGFTPAEKGTRRGVPEADWGTEREAIYWVGVRIGEKLAARLIDLNLDAIFGSEGDKS